MSKYGLNMINLVLTYLDHHWGHLWWFDPLKSIPVIHFGHFRNAWKWSLLGKLVILGHFGNDQNVSLELISVHQTIKGDPNDGLDKLKPNRSYLNHVPTWYSKSNNFAIEISPGKVACFYQVLPLLWSSCAHILGEWKSFFDYPTLTTISVTIHPSK